MKSKIMLKRGLDGDSMNNNVVKNPNKMKSFWNERNVLRSHYIIGEKLYLIRRANVLFKL